MSKKYYGLTTIYGEIAKQIALKIGISKISAQAVGNDGKANSIIIVIPFQVVTDVNGYLGGYYYGNKIALLKLEKVDLTQFRLLQKLKNKIGDYADTFQSFYFVHSYFCFTIL